MAGVPMTVHQASPIRPATPTAPRGRARAVAFARRVARQEPGLIVVGLAGLVLGVVNLVGVAVHGRTLPPEGKLLAAATFTFGVGVYTLTVAVLLPLAGYSPEGRRRWRRAYYVYPVYGLVLETVQAFRGLDPRFTEEGGTIDVVAGIVFGVTAGSTTVLFVLLGSRFFRPDVLDDRPVLRLGIRYGVVAVALSFTVGIVMSVNGGRELGDDGNLLMAHGLGVHGFQVLPLVAVAVSASTVTRPRQWVHVAGVAWLAACAAALLQATLGQPPMEPSALSVAIVAGVAAWAATVAAAVRLRPDR
jgi:hypothetical protein